MPNRTIYVSDADEKVFEEAKALSGEPLSSVIAKALRQYVQHPPKEESSTEAITLLVGPRGAQTEQRFLGTELGQWAGYSDEKDMLIEAKIYRTQKENLVVYLVHTTHSAFSPDPAEESERDSIGTTTLFVVKHPDELAGKVPTSLLRAVHDLTLSPEKPNEFLDI